MAEGSREGRKAEGYEAKKCQRPPFPWPSLYHGTYYLPDGLDGLGVVDDGGGPAGEHEARSDRGEDARQPKGDTHIVRQVRRAHRHLLSIKKNNTHARVRAHTTRTQLHS